MHVETTPVDISRFIIGSISVKALLQVGAFGKERVPVGTFSVHFVDQRIMDIEERRAAHTHSDRSYLDNKSVAWSGDGEKSVLGEHEECQLKGAWRGASSEQQTGRWQGNVLLGYSGTVSSITYRPLVIHRTDR